MIPVWFCLLPNSGPKPQIVTRVENGKPECGLVLFANSGLPMYRKEDQSRAIALISRHQIRADICDPDQPKVR
jgi:hypothetical protein